MMAISRINLTEFTNEIIANVRMPSATIISTATTPRKARSPMILETSVDCSLDI